MRLESSVASSLVDVLGGLPNVSVVPFGDCGNDEIELAVFGSAYFTSDYPDARDTLKLVEIVAHHLQREVGCIALKLSSKSTIIDVNVNNGTIAHIYINSPHVLVTSWILASLTSSLDESGLSLVRRVDQWITHNKVCCKSISRNAYFLMIISYLQIKGLVGYVAFSTEFQRLRADPSKTACWLKDLFLSDGGDCMRKYWSITQPSHGLRKPSPVEEDELFRECLTHIQLLLEGIFVKPVCVTTDPLLLGGSMGDGLMVIDPLDGVNMIAENVEIEESVLEIFSNQIDAIYDDLASRQRSSMIRG